VDAATTDTKCSLSSRTVSRDLTSPRDGAGPICERHIAICPTKPCLPRPAPLVPPRDPLSVTSRRPYELV